MGQEGGEKWTAAAALQPTIFCRTGSSQQVHPGVRQLGPGLDLRQQRSREHQRLADPVGLFNNAQAVGVAVGYEDSEGERGHWMLVDAITFAVGQSSACLLASRNLGATGRT